MDTICIFNGNLVFLWSIVYILWPFGLFCGHFANYFQFWYVVPRKVWQRWALHRQSAVSGFDSGADFRKQFTGVT
jgi:hypothetical protein